MKYTDSSLTQEYDSDEDEVFNAESDEESSESEAADSDGEVILNNSKRQSSRKPLTSKSSRNTPARKSTKVTLLPTLLIRSFTQIAIGMKSVFGVCNLLQSLMPSIHLVAYEKFWFVINMYPIYFTKICKCMYFGVAHSLTF